MVYKETAIKGVYVIEPKVFNDSRGYFFETCSKSIIHGYYIIRFGSQNKTEYIIIIKLRIIIV